MKTHTLMYRRLAVLGAAVMTLLAPAGPARAELADSPWPMFGRDLRHTGRGIHDGPQGPVVHRAWTYKAPAPFKEAPPTIGPDGTIYLAAGLIPLCAVNPTGTLKWCTAPPAGGAGAAAPTVGVDPDPLAGPGAVIYMGGRDNKTWAVKDDGQAAPELNFPGNTLLWRNKIVADGDVHSSALIDPETDAVYTACGCVTAGQLVALNPTPADMTDGPGEALWDAALIRPAVHYISPALDDRINNPDLTANLRYRRVYIGSWDGKLHAFTPDDVNKKWKKEWLEPFSPLPKGNNKKSSPVIGDDGTIYFGTYVGLSAVTDLGASAVNKWSVPFVTNDRVDATPSLSQDGNTIYFGVATNPIRFYAVNTATGIEKWRYPGPADPKLDGLIDLQAAIGANGMIYVPAGKTVYAFKDDGTQATLKWSHQVGGVILGVSIGGDGILYVTANDQKLYRIEDGP